MSLRISTRRELELMQRLQQLADTRAAAERTIAATFAADKSTAEGDYQAAVKRTHDAHAALRRQLENEYAEARRIADAAFDLGRQTAETDIAAARTASQRQRAADVHAAEHHAHDAEWQALAVYDAAKNQPPQLLDDATKRIQSIRAQVEGLERDARTLLEMRKLAAAADALPSPTASAPDLGGRPRPSPAPLPQKRHEELLQTSLAEARSAVISLQNQQIASLFLEGGWAYVWFAIVLVVVGVIGGVAGGVFGGMGVWGWLAGAGVGALLGAGLVAFFVPRGRRQSLAEYQTIRRMLEESRERQRVALADATAISERLTEEITRRRDQDVAAAREAGARRVAEIEARFAKEIAEVEAKHAARIAELVAERDRAHREADAKFPPQLEENAAQRVREEAENVAARDRRLELIQSQHDSAWNAMANGWKSGFGEVAGALSRMEARAAEFYPDWSKVDLANWHRLDQRPEALRFGQCTLPLAAVKNGVPDDPRLDPGADRLPLLAAMTFEEHPRLVITAEGEGKRVASDTLQVAMLRLLTAMPAGKVRFTIFDAAGLGDNFAAFMHLADYDEQIISGRIFTSAKQIDERLALLSNHMEKVLQKYLRNEFATIDEYNATAGEVAEPYQVVVAANFPEGFTDSAARKLVSIAANGPRCGVFVLTSVDRGLKLPHEFRLAELTTGALHLDWVDGRMVWRYPLFEKLELTLDPPPAPELLTEVLRVAGKQSRDASRVEVPFALAAPAPGDYWTHDSSKELATPIGRAGAKELQSMRLGLGTAQHVLISGKTGSGKSTLLHALITNLALHYGPDQVEFYLVDFKKGVEFKAYATGELPHARVIAIESEREFGVSVLERLDRELKRRGELYRQYGVQDLAGFRKAAPEIPMPRTLLIVDEFQELFVADDRIAQDAALLLDRLVRQGRAFGVHVLLGSQTLAGAYSLARATLGQMAVRIALECSEADSHIILSDENNAARLLSRPGEAIYNDQNGLVAGNHSFQVVWLPDPERQKYLAAMRALPPRATTTDEPAIIFEGNVPADPETNDELVAALAGPGDPNMAEAPFWLGSAVRIEPPTQLVLRRQGGHNLAILGPHESMAVGILTTAIVAMAAQQGDEGARFTILDGARPESEFRGFWPRVAAALGEAAEVVAPRETAAAVTALADEVTRRTQSPQDRWPSRYLIVYDLAQFRDLRQTEDDISFSFSKSKTPSVDRRFRDILREGPAVGVHVLFWCESYNSMNRSVDRIAMREIEYRVAMQMSTADSTSFLDSPAAALLGEHRALLYRDDLGTVTKFRPYGTPTDQWLASVERALSRKRIAAPQA